MLIFDLSAQVTNSGEGRPNAHQIGLRFVLSHDGRLFEIKRHPGVDIILVGHYFVGDTGLIIFG